MTRRRFRPARPARVSVEQRDFARDMYLIRVTDGILSSLMPMSAEVVEDLGVTTVKELAVWAFNDEWRRVIAARTPRMRAAYDRRRRARRRKARA